MLSTHLIIGEVSKPHGVKGEIKVRPITFTPMRFEGLTEVFFLKNGEYVPQKVRVTRIEFDAVYLFFQGISDRTAADALRGETLYIDRANAVELPEDTEFIVDLIGCVATDDNGELIGTLKDILQPGGNDVYVFSGPKGEVLVPALKSVVLHVDVLQKVMTLSAARLSEVAVYDDL